MTSHSPGPIEAKAATHAAMFYFRKPSTMDELTELGAVVRNVLTPGDRGSVDRRH